MVTVITTFSLLPQLLPGSIPGFDFIKYVYIYIICGINAACTYITAQLPDLCINRSPPFAYIAYVGIYIYISDEAQIIYLRL